MKKKKKKLKIVNIISIALTVLILLSIFDLFKLKEYRSVFVEAFLVTLFLKILLSDLSKKEKIYSLVAFLIITIIFVFVFVKFSYLWAL